MLLLTAAVLKMRCNTVQSTCISSLWSGKAVLHGLAYLHLISLVGKGSAARSNLPASHLFGRERQCCTVQSTCISSLWLGKVVCCSPGARVPRPRGRHACRPPARRRRKRPRSAAARPRRTWRSSAVGTVCRRGRRRQAGCGRSQWGCLRRRDTRSRGALPPIRV